MAAAKNKLDADYLKQSDIGLVIAKGMAVTYKEKPANPIDFFAKWLLNNTHIAQVQVQEEEKKIAMKEIQDKYTVDEKIKKKADADRLAEQLKIDAKKAEFDKAVMESKDLSDQLEYLVKHLKEFTKSTAVYVGKILMPLKPITDSDNDTAHVDSGAQSHIQFMHASEGYSFLVDKTLKQEQGITYKLFNPDEEEEEEKKEEEEENSQDAAAKKEPVEKLPKHINITEVVREPKIHFYQVPRLGSYLAVKLEYDSCLFQQAFDSAVDDFKRVDAQNHELEKEKRAFEEEQNDLKAEKEDAGETYEPIVKDWPEYKHAAFKTKKIQYVICLNTMGQDREFTPEQKLTALRTVQQYRDRWEKLEQENLETDVTKAIERSEYSKVYKEHYESIDLNELERIVEESVANAQPADGEEALSDTEKNMISLKSRFVQVTRAFHAPEYAAQYRAKQERLDKDKKSNAPGDRTQSAMGSVKDGSNIDDKSQIGGFGSHQPLVPEQWKEKIREFQNIYVVKYPRIFQSLIYLLKYKDREAVSERDTNKLEWKKVKMYLNDDLFQKMGDYWPLGPKEDDYKEYEKLKFVQTNLEGIVEDQVDEYSIGIGKLLRWIKMAIEVRYTDVKNRRENKKQLAAERQEAQDKEAERQTRRNVAFEDAKTVFDTNIEAQKAAKEPKEEPAEGEEGEEGEKKEEAESEYPEFDGDETYAKFDEEFPAIEIPDKLDDDIDNDFNLVIEDTPPE